MAVNTTMAYGIMKRSIKHLSTSTPTGASSSSSSSAVVRSPSPHPAKSSKNENPEKEKKRKELSSGRQKKFHRHFQQVAADERVINYFSCALVSDILLQGHLYITDNYFAFYSNVFGFVTKLLIPTVSVVKISKEKTAKIIPNAVGVATADERHVFGSFMSREAAYRLMLSVWRPVAPVEPEIIPKLPDVEISECSIEDDSSSAISGNESPPRGIQDSTTSTDASHTMRHRIGNPTGITTMKDDSSQGPNVDINDIPTTKQRDAGLGVGQPSRSTSPPPKIISIHRFYHIKFPGNFRYFGIGLSILLALLSIYLFYRIMNVQGRTSNFSPFNKWNAANKDMDVYAEVLKWQKEMQTKGVDEAQIIINSNLEQIARVRKSLETLSILIHDKNSFSLPEQTSETYVPDKDSPLDVSSVGRSET